MKNPPPHFQHLKGEHSSFSKSDLYESYSLFIKRPESCVAQSDPLLGTSSLRLLPQRIWAVVAWKVMAATVPFTKREASYKYLSEQPLIWNLD